MRKPKLKKLKDKYDKYGSDASASSFQFKSKSRELLDKTKSLFKDIEDYEEILLSEHDLSDLQSGISEMISEVKEEKEQVVEWESIKTFDKVRERMVSVKMEYWVPEFMFLIAYYLQKEELNEALYFMKHPKRLHKPILARIYEKLKSSGADLKLTQFL